jgi:hypothetical protein
MAQTSGTLAPGAYEDVSADPFPALAGPHTICVVADDDGLGSGSVAECSESNNERCDALVFCSGAPQADAGGPYAQHCDGSTARVQLDGSGSSDPESGPLTYAWITDCPGGTFSDPAGVTPILSMQCAPPCPLACAVTLIATDAQGGQDADTAGVSVQVDPLGELSNVSRGAPALRVVDTTPNGVVVEKDPHATAYNVYADALGSWYAPTAAKGTACGISTWSDNRDGTVTLDYQVPPNSWVVVTTSNACHEGSAGSRSDGTSRTEIGTWPSCGSPW